MQKADLLRLLERFPAIRRQLMAIADYRYHLATARDTTVQPVDNDSDNPVVMPVSAAGARTSQNPDLAIAGQCSEHVSIYVLFVNQFACVNFCFAVSELKFL